MSMADALIDVADLAKTYDTHSAVRDVTLRLFPGEIIALMGANGGGKTTSLRILAGLLRPDSGTGTVLGEDVRRLRPERRRRLGYMSQRLALYPDLSVTENMRFHAALHGFADPMRRVTQSASQFGLADVLHKPFGHLSGGWARRVQFATAILHNPSLLLLDEPTAGLDLPTQKTLWRWLAELAHGGHGIVVSTHDPREAAQCARIIFYGEGRAHPAVTPGDLLRQTGAPSMEEAVMALAGRSPR